MRSLSVALALLVVGTSAFDASSLGAQRKPRENDLKLPIGGTPGALDAITDVAGVEVGHSTIIAGSGALGFEAASRGAAKVVMVEAAPKVLAALEENGRMLGAGARLEIVRSDAVKFATATALRFDVLFLDPPYRQGWLDRLAPLLPRIATDHALLYVEAEAALEGCGDWCTVRHGKAGQVFYHLMQRGGANGAE